MFSTARRWLSNLLEEPVVSSLYRSDPLIDRDQEPFWNAVVSGLWKGTAESLLERLLMFEAGQGRVRDPLRPKGPRVLDLDLLFFGQLQVCSPRLQLPHAGLLVRRFVLEPLAEIQPLLQDPITGQSLFSGLPTMADQAVDRTDRTW